MKTAFKLLGGWFLISLILGTVFMLNGNLDVGEKLSWSKGIIRAFSVIFFLSTLVSMIVTIIYSFNEDFRYNVDKMYEDE